MTQKSSQPQTDKFNIVVIGQAGRLEYEAALFAVSFAHFSPDFKGQLYVAEPMPGPRWSHNTRISNPVRELLETFGAKVISFQNNHFGESYPYGNKIEALSALPEGEPFIFFDSDTLVLGDLSALPFPWSRPSASMKREGTWPEIELYGPGYGDIWRSLYEKFDLDYESSLDLVQPDEYWERYLYFNAGWFFGSCPRVFGETFTNYAVAIRDDPPETLVCQSLDPWLDQVALPLVIHALGGGRPGPELAGLDHEITCHWRVLPLLYARENDHVIETLEHITAPHKIKKVLKNYEPMKRFIYQGRGHKARALFDRNNLPKKEKALRNKLKSTGFWMR